jgi:hypothetical protein
MCREPHLEERLQVMMLELDNLLQVSPQLFNHLPIDMRRLCTAESAPHCLRVAPFQSASMNGYQITVIVKGGHRVIQIRSINGWQNIIIITAFGVVHNHHLQQHTTTTQKSENNACT